MWFAGLDTRGDEHRLFPWQSVAKNIGAGLRGDRAPLAGGGWPNVWSWSA